MGLALKFLLDDSGATAIEYGLLAALVAVAAIVSFGVMGNGLQNLIAGSGDKVGVVAADAVSNT